MTDPRLKLHVITGARPNYMKIMPIWRALKTYHHVEVTWIHTGQHSDPSMSTQHFKSLFAMAPEYDLHGRAHTLLATKATIEEHYDRLLDGIGEPDWVFIPGDVISSAAIWYIAASRNLNVVHLEAGLRSSSSELEETHRRMIDSRCSLYVAHSDSAERNLLAEGKRRSDIILSGNFMIDTMKLMDPAISRSQILAQLGLKEFEYVLFTMHHDLNVGDPARLRRTCEQLEKLSKVQKIIFPAHTRSLARLDALGLSECVRRFTVLLEPLDYANFIKLAVNSQYVVTDSDGLQEECVYLKKICFAVRDHTARPDTITAGSTHLIKPDDIARTPELFEDQKHRRIEDIPLWDGHATERFIEKFQEIEPRLQAPAPRRRYARP